MIIEQINIKEGVHKFDAISAVKKAFNLESLNHAKVYLDSLVKYHFNLEKGEFDFDMDENIIDELKHVFDITPRIPGECELNKKMEKEYAEAAKWMATLSEKEQEYIRILQSSMIARG